VAYTVKTAGMSTNCYLFYFVVLCLAK